MNQILDNILERSKKDTDKLKLLNTNLINLFSSEIESNTSFFSDLSTKEIVDIITNVAAITAKKEQKNAEKNMKSAEELIKKATAHETKQAQKAIIKGIFLKNIKKRKFVSKLKSLKSDKKIVSVFSKINDIKFQLKNKIRPLIKKNYQIKTTRKYKAYKIKLSKKKLSKRKIKSKKAHKRKKVVRTLKKKAQKKKKVKKLRKF